MAAHGDRKRLAFSLNTFFAPRRRILSVARIVEISADGR